MRSRILSVFCCALAMLAAAGCGHYQLGTENELTFASVYLEPVDNTANLPQATALFATQIREAFLRDSRVVLANSAESADVTLHVDLSNYSRRVATVRRNDTGLARSFDLELQAVCTLRDNRTGKLLFAKRPVNATRQVFTSDGTTELSQSGEPIFVSRQLQAEYQTLPLLASTLADRVAHAVLDTW